MKICQICKEDCSARARVKDPQGNYYCKACLDAQKAERESRAAAAAAAASGPEDEGYDLVAALGGEGDPVEAGAGSVCPQCGRAMKGAATLCVHCGYNAEAGQSALTRVSVERAPRERRSMPRIELGGGGLFLLLMALGAAPFAMGFNNEGMLLLYFAYASVVGLVAVIYLIVAAFSDGDTGWGIFAIVSALLSCLWIINLYYVFFVSERGRLKAIVGAAFLLSLGAGALSTGDAAAALQAEAGA